MTDNFQVSQATNTDIPAISRFLEKSTYLHRHLDWRPLMEWTSSEPFLLLKDETNAIHAILALPPDPPQIAWVHCFAADKTRGLNSLWQTLYSHASIILGNQNAIPYAVGLEDWFTNLLLEENFTIFQKIVVLSWNHHLPSTIDLPAEVTLRPMCQSDLEEVAEVDAASFEPVWVNSLNLLRLAYMQSERSTVAVVNGKIVGYEISTANQYSAHLARLAVLPQYRHRLIGKSLVREMLVYSQAHGMMQVTVNTQSTNSTSLHIYQSLGFLPTYEEYPVLTQNIK